MKVSRFLRITTTILANRSQMETLLHGQINTYTSWGHGIEKKTWHIFSEHNLDCRILDWKMEDPDVGIMKSSNTSGTVKKYTFASRRNSPHFHDDKVLKFTIDQKLGASSPFGVVFGCREVCLKHWVEHAIFHNFSC